jgi:hypothetical protein
MAALVAARVVNFASLELDVNPARQPIQRSTGVSSGKAMGTLQWRDLPIDLINFIRGKSVNWIGGYLTWCD